MYYTEDDLVFLYEDLLSMPSKSLQSKLNPKIMYERIAQLDAEVVSEAERRLSQIYPGLSGQALDANQVGGVSEDVPTYRTVLKHARTVVSRIEEMRELAMRGSDIEGRPVAGPSKFLVPISVLSIKECESLIRLSVCKFNEMLDLLSLLLTFVHRRKHRMDRGPCSLSKLCRYVYFSFEEKLYSRHY